MLRRTALITSAVALLPSCAAGAPALKVSATPALYPSFSQRVSDYVVRCGDQPVTLRAVVPESAQLATASGRPHTGSFAKRIALRAGKAFTFATRTPSLGLTQHHVRCLPDDFPTWRFLRTGPPSQQWYAVAPTLNPPPPGQPMSPTHPPYAIIFDGHGVPVWWFKSADYASDLSLMPDGLLAWSRSNGHPFGTGDVAWDFRRLDGRLVRTLTVPGGITDFHDLQPLSNGHYLVTAYPPRGGVDLSPWGGPSDATIVDGAVEELTAGGHVVWSWSTNGHIALDEAAAWLPALAKSPTALPDGSHEYDPFHINSVDPLPNGNLIVSLRHANAVYEINRHTGKVIWKLGGTTTPQSLKVLGDPLGAQPFGGQHDARWHPDGTLTVHDNATNLNRPPRAVRYRISLAHRTARLLSQQSDPRVPRSPFVGSARLLDSGGWLVDWGGSSIVTEFSRTGKRVMLFDFSPVETYRAFPIPFGRLPAAKLRAGMDAQVAG
jgi:hypothetical protein